MTLAVINWLSISINLLQVILVIVCVLMTLIILMQRPKQEGLGAAFGGGVTDQVFGARTTNVLQRGTVYLGTTFFILSLLLAILIGQKNKTKTLVSAKEVAAQQEKAKELAKPVEVKVPEAPKSLSTELPASAPAPAPTEAPKEISPALPDASPAVPEGAKPAEVPAPTPAPAEPAKPADK
jgi:preprotein translocase subunit SecG